VRTLAQIHVDRTSKNMNRRCSVRTVLLDASARRQDDENHAEIVFMD
jgi:hypothetical protein